MSTFSSYQQDEEHILVSLCGYYDSSVCMGNLLHNPPKHAVRPTQSYLGVLPFKQMLLITQSHASISKHPSNYRYYTMVSLPQRTIWSLHMNWQKKVGLSMTFRSWSSVSYSRSLRLLLLVWVII